MSLIRLLREGIRRRFPRVSGDEPGLQRIIGDPLAFSPRERG